MLTKNEIQFLKDLQIKKSREEHGLFICEGEKLLEELLSSNWEIQTVYAVKDANPVLKSKCKNLVEISDKDLDRISALQTPNQFLAVVKQKKFTLENLNIKSEIILILDKINDPGNLGTIIRTADWFGVNQIICAINTVDLYNSKTIQSAMGSVFHTNVFYMNLPEAISHLKSENYRVLAAEMKGENAFSFKPSGKIALVMGSESHGLSPDLRSFIDQSITIPSYGKAESLNVAVATSILLASFKQ